MNGQELDLWPDEISVDALSPVLILNRQAEALTRRTQGIVRGELTGTDDPSGITVIYFDLVAPAAKHRRRVLAVRYIGGNVYPAVVTSHDYDVDLTEGPFPDEGWGIESYGERRRSRVSYTPTEFEKYLSEILKSGSVKSAVFALIAKSNELRLAPSLSNNSEDQ